MFKTKTAQKANKSFNMPAPVAGLDAATALMSMPTSQAVILENFFPRPDGLELRDGYVAHVTGFAAQIAALHVHAAATGGESLWATTASGIYAATIAGAVGAAVMALTEGKTISTTISTGAGNYLMLANGVDTIKQYDGTTWSSIATFGVTATSSYSYVETYRQRLFLVKKNSLEIEYLASNAISGTATNYPLGANFRQGGYIIAIGTWTIDSGTGPEDKLAIVTNKGEVAVFNGNDPATWSFQGVYSIGRPIGARCLFKYGGDLLIITESGLFPLSGAVQSTSIDRQRAVSERIKPLFAAAATSFQSNAGWQIISDPLKPCLIVNIPSTPVKKQFVMHSQTKAWTTYSGWDATCFARMGSEIYFGTTTEVCRVNGNSDKGANIVGTMLQAHSRLERQQNKKIELVKPYISNNNGFSYVLGVANDFSDPREKTYPSSGSNATAAIWGTSIFGAAHWTGIVGISQDWQTVPDDHTLWKALYLQVTSNTARIRYFGSDMLFVLGEHF